MKRGSSKVGCGVDYPADDDTGWKRSIEGDDSRMEGRGGQVDDFLYEDEYEYD